MGMYDSFYFEDGVLPNNRVEGKNHEFQSKDLRCDMDIYEIDKNLNVLKYPFWEEGYEDKPEPLDELINECAIVYSYEFPKDGPAKIQHYKILIHNNKLVHVKKLSEENYVKED